MKMHRRASLLTYLLLSLLLGVLGKEAKPTVSWKSFPEIPAGLFYFEDSNVVFVTDPKARTTYRSENAGAEWKRLDIPEGQVLEILKHPYNNQVAVVIGTQSKHWITKDQGETWQKFECQDLPTVMRPVISFHAADPDRMLFHTANCDGRIMNCEESVYYTTDGFDSNPKVLHKDAVSCLWAKTTDLFTTGNKDSDKQQVLCIVKGAFNSFSNSYRLLASDDFFQTELEPAMNEGRTVSGVTNLAAVKSYMVAVAKSEGTTELAMYVTDDASTWHRAEFGEHKLEEDAYTLLESTNYSMQVDVLTTRPTSPMGVLLTSNSNGTFFTKNVEHTNRNIPGFVDFEKIQNIQGIVLVNTVHNWDEVERAWITEKKIKSQISFDDGRTWQPLKAGEDDLHLHSVTEQRNLGRIFSSPAPGIVMGVGNTGKYLSDYDDGDLYVSDDAGFTWKRALEGPHLYEFGDQGSILVAIEEGETDEIKWSLDHGDEWHDMELEEDIKPIALTTVPDSTSLKFILTASQGRGQDTKYFIYFLDFDGLHEGVCKTSDFEDWYARGVDENGEPTCIMGHTQKFRRRKAGAKCLINNKQFEEAVPVAEDCKCQDEDFECDYENGFTHSDGNCVLTGQMPQPEGACGEGDKKFMGSSGYRLIPGNTCVKKGGKELDEPIERPCKDLNKPVASGKITNDITRFKGESFLEYFYRERGETSHGDDETVIMRTDHREVYLTADHGKTWRSIVPNEEIVAIYPHSYINDNVYLITPSDKVYYSKNRGSSFSTFDAPEKPNMQKIQILSFHPTREDWLIWTGGKETTAGVEQSIAHVSRHGGDGWVPLLRSVRKCQFVYREGRQDSDKLIYCEQYEDYDPSLSLSLMSSNDWFETKNELKRDVINFATMAEYIVVAVREPDQESLQVDTSIDGKVFADAKFPTNFQVPHQQAYTVLDSSTHAVFLHVTVNNRDEQEYGSIIKSNSNGTSYVLSVSEVNRNHYGYVDFEKMQGLEGVAIINRVANVEQVESGSAKKLRTCMTHNDGADWALLPRPEKAFDGKDFECDGGTEKCSLHLHGYTERKDPRDTFSSASAIGLMIGTGNVGEYLGYKKDADTFITRDGGLNWEAVAPGNWMWEYGDQGSIIVIVKEDQPTNNIKYSLNEGESWATYEFSDQEMLVQDISTVPSDMSMNFLLWGKIRGELVTVNIDFSGLEEREGKCKLDENNPTGKNSDYKLWSPAHPNSEDDCLFGHIAQYHRKKLDSKCRNGDEKMVQHLHKIQRNCTCTRADFECDYNFERVSDGHCKLVEGLKTLKPEDVCKKDPDLMEYSEITGYRRIPLTTCEGGVEYDLTSATHSCPGHEPEYAKKHGISGIGLFFAIVLPVAAAAGIGYWVWQNWDNKFGRIRLGGDSGPLATSTGYSAFDRDAPWIKFPVMAVSGIVAVLAAVPMLVGSLWSFASTRLGRSRGGSYARPYTSRSSFARGRRDYAVVGDDEGSLLGEESDDDV